MNINFDELDLLSSKFLAEEDVDLASGENRHVFSISFEPSLGRIRVHVEWLYFRNLVSLHANGKAKCSRMPEKDFPGTMYWEVMIQNCEVVAVMNKYDIIQMLKNEEGMPDSYDDLKDDGVEGLFNLWQGMTNWNMGIVVPDDNKEVQ